MKITDINKAYELANDLKLYENYIKVLDKMNYIDELEQNDGMAYITFLNVPVRVRDMNEDMFYDLLKVYQDIMKCLYENTKNDLKSFGVRL
mgnify:FL=1